MIGNEAQAARVTKLLSAASCANTAAATSGWVAVAEFEGDIMFIENVGVVTGGTIDGKIQTASDGSGTGAADVAGATFTQATTSTDERVEKVVVPASKLNTHVRYVGTIVTGPAVVGVEMVARPKYF